MQNYTIRLDGLDEEVRLEYPSIWKAPRLYYGGRLLKPEGGLKKKYVLRHDGLEEPLQLKQDLSMAPTLVWRGVAYRTDRPLRWWEWALSCLPILLITYGGAIGGALGVVSTMFIASQMRRKINVVMKILLALGISIVATACYLVIALGINALFGR